ncbi:MAG TPA: transcriptional repressor [Terrimesophilobacter sp.]|nr:transcriptional repressor [Terrimesophilobacter sp.]
MPTDHSTLKTAPPVRRDTRQRRAVRNALQGAESFVSAQELHAQLRHGGTAIGLATVYRALTDLAEEGEADLLVSDDGEARYRACTVSEHHHHVVCRNCGWAIEVAGAAVERWAESVASEHGFSEAEHVVNVIGLCPKCTRAKREASAR